jgi:8-oxo-dGTP pyrophosphatase MutT (NUDIX family)/GNAT superfamily N-acetyltransferase
MDRGKDIVMTEYITNMRKYIGHKRLLIIVASVFVHKDGKLLLQKRKDNGCWAEHGGCCELGETVDETAKRELLEETGLTANSLELLGIFSGKDLFYTYPNGDMVSNVNIAYLCEDFTGDLATQTNETTDLRWFKLNELPDNISPPVKPALKRCVEVLREQGKTKTKIDYLTLNVQYREQVDDLIAKNWVGPYIAVKGVLHDTRTHPGFVAVTNGWIAGYILYNILDTDCEITVLESLREKQGIGRALINFVIQTAKKAGCKRIWLITTNDNISAIRFYQKFGFELRNVYINAIEESRKLKPQIPLTGNDGIPIAHEIEFEMRL